MATPRRPEFRPTTSADAPALAALLGSTFGLPATSPTIHPDHLNWKYWLGREDWDGSRSFVLARGADLVAHAAVVPGRFTVGGSHFRTLHLIDWVARTDVPGAGIGLMKFMARMTDALVAIGGSPATLAILPTLGYQNCGQATRYVRMLRPTGELTATERLSWRVVPRFVRSLAWRLAAPIRDVPSWRSWPVSGDEAARLPLPSPGPLGAPVALERVSSDLRHALGCPTARTALYAVEKVGTTPVRGYFVLAFVAGQARVADWWVDSSALSDRRAVLDLAALRALEDPQAIELVALSSDDSLSTALAQSGFHARARFPVQMRATTPATPVPDRLSVQLIDNDAYYLATARIERWA